MAALVLGLCRGPLRVEHGVRYRSATVVEFEEVQPAAQRAVTTTTGGSASLPGQLADVAEEFGNRREHDQKFQSAQEHADGLGPKHQGEAAAWADANGE